MRGNSFVGPDPLESWIAHLPLAIRPKAGLPAFLALLACSSNGVQQSARPKISALRGEMEGELVDVE